MSFLDMPDLALSTVFSALAALDGNTIRALSRTCKGVRKLLGDDTFRAGILLEAMAIRSRRNGGADRGGTEGQETPSFTVALRCAAEKGDAPVLKQLAKSADADAILSKDGGMSLLHLAVMSGSGVTVTVACATLQTRSLDPADTVAQPVEDTASRSELAGMSAMHLAAYRGDPGVMDSLYDVLGAGSWVTRATPAVHQDPPGQSDRLALQEVTCTSQQNFCGMIPLHVAAFMGHGACVGAILARSSDETLANLVTKGVNVALNTYFANMPAMHLAAHEGHPACIAHMCAHLQQRHMVSPAIALATRTVASPVWQQSQMTVLHIAAQQGHHECISAFLEGLGCLSVHHLVPSLVMQQARSASFNMSALHIAACEGDHNCMDALFRGLLSLGLPQVVASLASQVGVCHGLPRYGMTALHIAMVAAQHMCVSSILVALEAVGRCDVIAELMTSPIAQRDDAYVSLDDMYRAENMTVLHLATLYGSSECINVLTGHLASYPDLLAELLLMTVGNSQGVTCYFGTTALHVAMIAGRSTCVAPLFRAVHELGRPHMFGEMALKAVANHQDTMYSNMSPLHIAVAQGHACCIGPLMDSLHATGQQGLAQAVSMLVCNGKTPMHLAAAAGDLNDCMTALLGGLLKGDHVHAIRMLMMQHVTRDPEIGGLAPLHIAAYRRCVCNVETMLSAMKKAGVSGEDVLYIALLHARSGPHISKSALHLACQCYRTVTSLLAGVCDAAGACAMVKVAQQPVSAPNRDANKVALDLARQRSATTVVSTLATATSAAAAMGGSSVTPECQGSIVSTMLRSACAILETLEKEPGLAATGYARPF